MDKYENSCYHNLKNKAQTKQKKGKDCVVIHTLRNKQQQPPHRFGVQRLYVLFLSMELITLMAGIQLNGYPLPRLIIHHVLH